MIFSHAEKIGYLKYVIKVQRVINKGIIIHSWYNIIQKEEIQAGGKNWSAELHKSLFFTDTKTAFSVISGAWAIAYLQQLFFLSESHLQL